MNILYSVFKKLHHLMVEVYFRLTIRCLHGSKKINCGPNDVVLTCLVRDGSPFINSFFLHYLRLGVKHFIFLDNGSTDDTVSLLKKIDNVTILSSHVSMQYMHAEVMAKQYLVEQCGRNKWCISADIDELFDYPFSNISKLGQLVNYLNQHSYTAVVTQMLDMFSENTANVPMPCKEELLGQRYAFYDISNITKTDYFSEPFVKYLKDNFLPNKSIKFHSGGIRKTIFGTANCLTKHQLILSGRARITHPHCASSARCADFTAVCLHYKLIDGFIERTMEYCKRKYGNTYEYNAIISKLENEGKIELCQQTARKLATVNELLDNDFLVASETYTQWIKAL